MRAILFGLMVALAAVAYVSTGWTALAALAGAVLCAIGLWTERGRRSPDVAGGHHAAPHRRPVSGPGGLDPDVAERVRAIALGGRKIEAIKLLRSETGMGLKEAKETVDDLVG